MNSCMASAITCACHLDGGRSHESRLLRLDAWPKKTSRTYVLSLVVFEKPFASFL
ncbi:MAG: hypothetical protein P8Y45_06140 [Exilibacterium sp.]